MLLRIVELFATVPGGASFVPGSCLVAVCAAFRRFSRVPGSSYSPGQYHPFNSIPATVRAVSQ